MILKILLKYILGYVKIDLEGYYIERFINICISKGIVIWNLKREKFELLHLNVGIDDYKKLREVCKRTNCKIKIKDKKGIPFFMNRYRKRKVFALFSIIIVMVLFVTSKFIWNVQIEGIDEISKEEILNDLEECGLKIGMRKDLVNTGEIINKIRLDRDDIAWINIDISGTNAIVEIAQRTEKPEIIKQDEYCNIIANKEAEITKITATNGTIIANVRR